MDRDCTPFHCTGLRHHGRLLGPPFAPPIGAGRGPGFIGRHCFLRRCSSGARLHFWAAGRLGHANTRLFCRVRHQPAGTVQCNSGSISDSSGKVKYFEGTPIPTSILIVMVLGVAFAQHAIESATWFGAYRLGPATVHPLTLLYAGSGAGMISATIRIPKP